MRHTRKFGGTRKPKHTRHLRKPKHTRHLRKKIRRSRKLRGGGALEEFRKWYAQNFTGRLFSGKMKRKLHKAMPGKYDNHETIPNLEICNKFCEVPTDSKEWRSSREIKNSDADTPPLKKFKLSKYFRKEHCQQHCDDMLRHHPASGESAQHEPRLSESPSSKPRPSESSEGAAERAQQAAGVVAAAAAAQEEQAAAAAAAPAEPRVAAKAKPFRAHSRPRGLGLRRHTRSRMGPEAQARHDGAANKHVERALGGPPSRSRAWRPPHLARAPSEGSKRFEFWKRTRGIKGAS